MKEADIAVLKNDIQYIREAVQEIKAETKGVRVHKWAIGILFTWLSAMTGFVLMR